MDAAEIVDEVDAVVLDREAQPLVVLALGVVAVDVVAPPPAAPAAATDLPTETEEVAEPVVVGVRTSASSA
jgi:hypothetical protein